MLLTKIQASWPPVVRFNSAMLLIDTLSQPLFSENLSLKEKKPGIKQE